MPPAISDDESSDVDAHLPVASWRDDDDSDSRSARRSAAAAEPQAIDVDVDDEDGAEPAEKAGLAQNGDDKDEDEDEEGEEDVFIVEVIKKHMIDEDIGGRDSIFQQTATAASGKKRGRKAGVSGSADPTPVKRSRKSNGAGHPGATSPPASSKPWSPPAGSWEDDIDAIDACQDEGTGQLMVYLVWKNGKKTRHTTSVIYAKCPQKFYERHVKIVKPEES
ncbi:Chromatin-associated protein swi6 [Beauveria bassiana]|uniref:Chromatin-associated protein swi6 n=1 Tax=Beauveria bassiana TaxID=176275 RepID=A0A2N6NCM2_BEABA|nr:Chromatin-associated protein swi6 [Beauveria bassiana]